MYQVSSTVNQYYCENNRLSPKQLVEYYRGSNHRVVLYLHISDIIPYSLNCTIYTRPLFGDISTGRRYVRGRVPIIETKKGSTTYNIVGKYTIGTARDLRKFRPKKVERVSPAFCTGGRPRRVRLGIQEAIDNSATHHIISTVPLVQSVHSFDQPAPRCIVFPCYVAPPPCRCSPPLR